MGASSSDTNTTSNNSGVERYEANQTSEKELLAYPRFDQQQRPGLAVLQSDRVNASNVQYNSQLLQKVQQAVKVNTNPIFLSALKEAVKAPDPKDKNYDDLLRGKTSGQVYGERVAASRYGDMAGLSSSTNRLIERLK